jgi:hypothetical protein
MAKLGKILLPTVASVDTSENWRNKKNTDCQASNYPIDKELDCKLGEGCGNYIKFYAYR